MSARYATREQDCTHMAEVTGRIAPVIETLRSAWLVQ
jgi:hypothetical protein